MTPALAFHPGTGRRSVWTLILWAGAALVCSTAAEPADPAGAAGSGKAVSPGARAGGAAGATQLQQRIDRGAAQLSYEPQFGYLRSVLKELGIRPESQLLVFSKTSGQREHISPSNPRAIYFNEQAYVAFVPGAPLLEISCVDPKLGAVFYSIDQRPNERPNLVRREQCLECHTSTQTLNVPGYLVRSYATDGRGVIDMTHGYSMVDHRTPLEERWGGWYLCGSGASVNFCPPDKEQAERQGSLFSLGQASLNRMVDLTKYPWATSDIVALLVFEHQAQMQNLLTQLHHEADRDAGTEVLSTHVKALANVLVKYLLFAEEAPLNAQLTVSPEFTAGFVAQGSQDGQGRSLRQFDLKTRLFKYPCSYLIYSESFDALPRPVKLHLYRRLWSILHGEDSDPAWARIEPPTRQAILEILGTTKADLPVSWHL